MNKSENPFRILIVSGDSKYYRHQKRFRAGDQYYIGEFQICQIARLKT
jgi:hypothetical protein